uniref:Peptidase A9 domain-containing protein n=1 Tax=Rhizophagus irregularis (strain DAOM 181602 / DAOM 197198 / MUCL 43194) TaxID=747089 RepID=U9T3I6_RHIID
MSRLNPLEGTLKENPTEEENVLRATQQVNKSKRPIKISDVRQTEAKRIVQKGTKKKLVTVAPINKMVEPYTPQQFFDQKADITNGQLLAMNPKFGLTIAKQLRKPVVRKRDDDQDKKTIKMVIDEVTQENGNTPEVNDLLQVNLSKPNDDKTSALYCEALINHIKFPLIVDSGSAGRFRNGNNLSVKNCYGQRKRNIMVIKWQDETFEVATECREMPQHIVSIEVPDLEVDENEEEAANESEEEEYESDDEETQDQLFCNAQFITKEQAQEIEDDLKDNKLVKNEFYYQYEEIEKGNFHTGKLSKEQHQKFRKFMERHQNLFAWNPNDFGQTSVITHSIDTGTATPVKQRFYQTSYQN